MITRRALLGRARHRRAWLLEARALAGPGTATLMTAWVAETNAVDAGTRPRCARGCSTMNFDLESGPETAGDHRADLGRRSMHAIRWWSRFTGAAKR